MKKEITSAKKPNYHNRKVESIKKFWGFFGCMFPLESEKGNPRYFKPDLIVDISHQFIIAESLDCSYIWVEIVKEHPCTPDKKGWLPKLLSKKWLILTYDYGEPFTPQRPVTYIENGGKMTSEMTEEILDALIQQVFKLRQKLGSKHSSSSVSS